MAAPSGGEHVYRCSLAWEGNRGGGTATYQGYDRLHRVRLQGKPDLLGSADPAFRGDPARHNPEDLLVAALSACHMLSYLALCARNGVTVMTYTDEAQGVMALTPDGGGKFTSATLHPRVAIREEDKVDLALALHARAHAECFIANSCNFPVRNLPTVTAG
ncbi:MAG: OsmC family protein [Holophaga sp.]|jgi:organic hydroperoxide reductase OsmC/OhrA